VARRGGARHVHNRETDLSSLGDFTIGGLVIGLGGLVFPQALGAGYDTIGTLLQGDVPGRVIVGILLVKSIIWSVSLGSGTSGGVLAPLRKPRCGNDGYCSEGFGLNFEQSRANS